MSTSLTDPQPAEVTAPQRHPSILTGWVERVIARLNRIAPGDILRHVADHNTYESVDYQTWLITEGGERRIPGRLMDDLYQRGLIATGRWMQTCDHTRPIRRAWNLTADGRLALGQAWNETKTPAGGVS